jgi:sporulation protein YlmC with PRC-barrel domain
MPRMNEVVGKTVITPDTGTRLGQVDDLLLDDERERVAGVLVGKDWRRLFGAGRVLPYTAVRTVENDAVIARDELVPLEDWRDAGRPTEFSSRGLTGKAVMTAAGARIGTVIDATFDAATGRIESLTLVSDATAPPREWRIPVTRGVSLGDDVVVVPHDLLEEGATP